MCIYNIVHLPPHQPLRPHTCSSLPACPAPMWATPPPLASPWTLVSSAYSAAIQPCAPSTLKAPPFLSAEGPVNEDWKCLKLCHTRLGASSLQDMAWECPVCQAGCAEHCSYVSGSAEEATQQGSVAGCRFYNSGCNSSMLGVGAC